MAAPIQNVNVEPRKRRTKSGFLPMLDGDVVSRGVTKRILRYSCSITADVCPAQMQNAYVEPFDAVNLALNIGDGGHGFTQVYADVFLCAIALWCEKRELEDEVSTARVSGWIKR